jgi:hypothetical protein
MSDANRVEPSQIRVHIPGAQGDKTDKTLFCRFCQVPERPIRTQF